MKPLQLSAPHLIAIVGTPGAGKTQFAREFSDMFHAPLLSTHTFDELTENHKKIEVIMHDLLEQLMKTNSTIVLDGLTDQRVARTKLTQKAKQHGYNILFVWVQTDPVTAKARWMKQYTNDETAFQSKLRQFSPPHISEPYLVISGRHTFSTQARTVLKRLSAGRTDTVNRREQRPERRINIG